MRKVDYKFLYFLYKSNCPHAIYALALKSWLIKVRGMPSAMLNSGTQMMIIYRFPLRVSELKRASYAA